MPTENESSSHTVATLRQHVAWSELFLAPGAAVVASDGTGQPSADLVHADEWRLVSSAVERRRRAFGHGRACLRLACRAAGLPEDPVGRRPDRSPRLPAGVTGSITHTEGLVAAVVADATSGWSLGIDAERLDREVRDIADRILTPAERHATTEVDGRTDPVAMLRIFSAKESIYKSQRQLTGAWLGFDDVVTERLDDGLVLGHPLTPVAEDLGLAWPIEVRQAEHAGCVVSGASVRRAAI